jgi:phosphatidylglycerophosphatase A
MQPSRLLGTAFGLGLAPVAPGTFGTLAGVALGALALLLPPGMATQGVLALGIVVVTFAGVPLATRCERIFGRKDPGAFVLDEVAGYLVALLFLPLHERPYVVLVGAFFAFRLTDIVKPPPARRLERVSGGWGVMLDDLVAGAYANVVMQIAVRL